MLQRHSYSRQYCELYCCSINLRIFKLFAKDSKEMCQDDERTRKAMTSLHVSIIQI